MWPKAFSQLVELAPHISRLLPMADRFFQSKNVSEDSSRKAVDAMAEGLRGDFAEVTAAHASLHEQLLAFSSTLGSVAADVHATRVATGLATESLERRLSVIEARQTRTQTFFVVILGLLVCVCILLILLLVRGR